MNRRERESRDGVLGDVIEKECNAGLRKQHNLPEGGKVDALSSVPYAITCHACLSKVRIRHWSLIRLDAWTAPSLPLSSSRTCSPESRKPEAVEGSKAGIEWSVDRGGKKGTKAS